jgi:hypothetical protein
MALKPDRGPRGVGDHVVREIFRLERRNVGPEGEILSLSEIRKP